MHQIALTVSQNVLENHINVHSRQSMCSKCPPPACTYDRRWSRHWSIAASMMSWSKSNQVCIKRFRRSSRLWIFVSYTDCCRTLQISTFKAHDDHDPLWWSYDASDAIFVQVLSSSWDGRPFVHNRHEPKIGGCAPFGGAGSSCTQEGAVSPCNTMWPEPRRTFIPSGILIHPAVWPQQTWAENWAATCPFEGVELGPHLAQCGLGRGLPRYQVASWSIQPFGHNRHGPKTVGGGSAPFWGGSQFPLHKKGTEPLIFSPCLLWPNGWMDQDATGNEGGPRYRRHCVRLGPSPHRKGHSSPVFGPCLLWPNGWID